MVADPEPGDRGKPGLKRIGILSEQRDLAELYGHVADAYEPDHHKYADVVSWNISSWPLPPSVASVRRDNLLLRMGLIDYPIHVVGETSVTPARTWVSKQVSSPVFAWPGDTLDTGEGLLFQLVRQSLRQALSPCQASCEGVS